MSEHETAGHRFRDPLVRMDHFADEVLVRCPRCGGCAVVLTDFGAPQWRARALRRLRCAACGLAKDGYPGTIQKSRGPWDPCLGLPLWLQTGCCGETLWAYNVAHLDLLEAYVAARLRERGARPGSMSMVKRLPAWLKSAKHRAEVLRAVRRLRASLPAAPQEVMVGSSGAATS